VSAATGLRAIIVPGLILQAVLMGGAYATGREIVQFFTSFGIAGGLLALAFAFAGFLLTLILSFEFARRFNAYDYRTFFRHLIGPAWWLYEVLTFIYMLLILAVVTSAAGEAIGRLAGMGRAQLIGQILVLVSVTLLSFLGREIVIKSLSVWAVVTTGVFIVLSAAVVMHASEGLAAQLHAPQAFSPTAAGISGLQYVFYAIASAPLLFYSIRDLRTRAQTITAASVAAVLIVLPALLIHFALAAALPQILDEPLPIYHLTQRYLGPVFVVIYSVMLVGTLIDTSVGLLHGINERVDQYLMEHRGAALGRGGHAALALGFVLASGFLSSWGIVNLVSKGYGTLAWAFLLVYLLPLFTIGAWKIFGSRGTPT
jgi:uncharacterized membrane protein YkvI